MADLFGSIATALLKTINGTCVDFIITPFYVQDCKITVISLTRRQDKHSRNKRDSVNFDL